MPCMLTRASLSLSHCQRGDGAAEAACEAEGCPGALQHSQRHSWALMQDPNQHKRQRREVGRVINKLSGHKLWHSVDDWNINDQKSGVMC